MAELKQDIVASVPTSAGTGRTVAAAVYTTIIDISGGVTLSSGGGGFKIADLPEGAVYVLGIAGTVNFASNVVGNDASFTVGVGSTIGVGSALTTTEQNIGTVQTSGITASVGSASVCYATPVALGSGSSKGAVFLNFATATPAQAAAVITATGKLAITYVVCGDNND